MDSCTNHSLYLQQVTAAYPLAVRDSGHVFAAARTVAPNAALSGANLSDTMYFHKDRWTHMANRAMENWRRRWRLPSRIRPVLQTWVQEQWRRHEDLCCTHRTDIGHRRKFNKL